jgi:hypothetical protein
MPAWAQNTQFGQSILSPSTANGWLIDMSSQTAPSEVVEGIASKEYQSVGRKDPCPLAAAFATMGMKPGQLATAD